MDFYSVFCLDNNVSVEGWALREEWLKKLGDCGFGKYQGCSSGPIKGFHIPRRWVLNWKGPVTALFAMDFYSVFCLDNNVSVEGWALREEWLKKLGDCGFGKYQGCSSGPIKGFHIPRRWVLNWKGPVTALFAMDFYSVFCLDNNVSVEGWALREEWLKKLGDCGFGKYQGCSSGPIKGFHIPRRWVLNWKGPVTALFAMDFYSVFWLDNNVSVEGWALRVEWLKKLGDCGFGKYQGCSSGPIKGFHIPRR